MRWERVRVVYEKLPNMGCKDEFQPRDPDRELNKLLPSTSELEELPEENEVPYSEPDQCSESESRSHLPPVDPDDPVDLVDLLDQDLKRR
jgi:hypothetical protein